MEELKFRSALPSDDKYYQKLKICEEIKEFVYFTPSSSRLIIYCEEVVGFYRVFSMDDEDLDYEIQIAIFPEYQNKGIAKKTISKLKDNLFSNPEIRSIEMNIDKKNEASKFLAQSLGFDLNITKEKDFCSNGDDQTLSFCLENPNYIEKERANYK